MPTIRLTIALVLLTAGFGNAWAERGHHAHFGVMIAPYWGPSYYSPLPYYYPPYYPSPAYYPPLVVERPAPQVYIEQQAAPAAPTAPPAPVAVAPDNYWYYCAATKSYYPYVKECRSGWQRVLPQPPGQP